MSNTDLKMTERDARRDALSWIMLERERYANVKYDTDTDQRHKMILDMVNFGNLEDDSEWMLFIGNYLKRAQQLGLQHENGRQALGKLIVTLMHCLETSMMVYGQMPKPGYPSGELHPWQGT